MKIIDRILQTLPDEPVPVRKVIIGVHWTLVSSKYCGLGSTLVDDGPHGHAQVRDVGALQEKSAQELASWVLSDNLLEASIGIAALNSLLDLDGNHMEQINAAEVIARESRGRNLVVVGHFPFVDRLKGATKNCWVIEKHISGDDLPEEAAAEFIPQADVVAITGTAFINHTIDNLLSLCRPGAMVMILGPSTPMAPLLFDHGVTFLSGSRVIDEAAAIETIQQGASFPQVRGVRLLTMHKELGK
jgi:uncharacterized protein (DUF4213/DUF364 family)